MDNDPLAAAKAAADQFETTFAREFGPLFARMAATNYAQLRKVGLPRRVARQATVAFHDRMVDFILRAGLK